MNFIPVDTATTQPQSGGVSYPEGFYLFQIKDATEVRPTQDGSKQFRQYKCEVLMGPGWSQELKGKQFTDRIQEGEATWAPRHMELFVAALGSLETVRQTGAQHGGRLPAEILAGRYYIAQLVKTEGKDGKIYTNVQRRLPYTPENWNAEVGAPSAAPAPGAALVQQAQQVQAYAAAPPPAAIPAPAPAAAFTPPPAPPVFAPPAPPAISAMPGMPPLPPPPPGLPAGR